MSNSADGDFDSRYGIVHMSYPGPFKDWPYENVRLYSRREGDVILQGPALRAFRAAEQRITPKRMKRRGKTRYILITGVGYRSYSHQKALYQSDPGRYADPDTSNHVEALAVDLDTGWFFFDKAKAALKAEGFNFTVDGEPWHGAFRMTG